jgi:putative SOS response-associated peptidase YedK
MILESEAANDWLGGDRSMLDTAAEKCPALRAWPVDRRVNNARNDGEGLIDPDGDMLSD